MKKGARFKVDPNLTRILGENYSSVEAAIKELIDNCYDADAGTVKVSFPEPFQMSEILIEDDGDGMTPNEVREQYLKIASSRYTRKGSITFGKKRKVKGRKGIGKFAGLTIANFMEIKTKARGEQTTLLISKEDILGQNIDLENIELPIEIVKCDKSEHGTTISLRGLNQNLQFPNTEKLKGLVVREYLRENGFKVYINDEDVKIEDLPGQHFTAEIEMEDGKKAIVSITVTDKPSKFSGLNYRVDGKIVGRPVNLLAENELIPASVQKRIVVEVSSDSLIDDTTADWGEINESSKVKQFIEENLPSILVEKANEACKSEMQMAKARHQKKMYAMLSRLPENRRFYAKVALERVIDRFWTEEDSKIETLISVMIDALEKGQYWEVIQSIEQAEDHEIQKLAEAFNAFGLYEIALMTQEATARLKFLEKMEILLLNPETLEKEMHQALEKNLWVFGHEYAQYISNQTLKVATETLLNRTYKGENARKRPDLYLGMAFTNEKLLIEFKRPNYTLGRDDEAQAQTYRDELLTLFPNDSIRVMLVGGKKGDKINQSNNASNLNYCTYFELIANARANFEWLIKNLVEPNKR